jgi:hypothetical protein
MSIGANNMSSIKPQCLECKKHFTKETLTKNGRSGVCGRCDAKINNPLMDIDRAPRSALSKLNKKLLWEMYYCNRPDKCPDLEKPCVCCWKRKTCPFTCEFAHIVAYADGGDENLDNIIPTCGDCNRGSGTINLLKYAKKVAPGDVYTWLILKWQSIKSQ